MDFEPFKKGKFIDSELGMIPEGWQVEELGNITNSINGESWQANRHKSFITSQHWRSTSFRRILHKASI